MGLITAASRYTTFGALDVPYLASPVDLTPGMIITICCASCWPSATRCFGRALASAELARLHVDCR